MNQATQKRCFRARHNLGLAAILVMVILVGGTVRAEVSGFLTKDGKRLFPIGCYELPKEDEALGTMAASGINLVRCRNAADLDRAAAAGIQGWVPVPLQLGDNEKLKQQILDVKDHPALAVWEGPDEIVHSFTRFSGLYRTLKVHKSRSDWTNQVPEAVAYAKEQAAKIIPGLRAGAALIRKLDDRKRPIWMNEAMNSDLKYVRGYLDSVDIIGCDIYPVRSTSQDVFKVGAATERWKLVGRGTTPVWMVIQAFSWHELGDYYGVKEAAYPTFDQSRHMAYGAIVHGAKGILYWGSNYLKSDEFRRSVYALTRELAALQPFLVTPDVGGVNVTLIETDGDTGDLGVRGIARKAGEDWIIVLVNEDDRSHLGVEVSGLAELNGRRLVLLYGDEETTITHGELLTRMVPYQVKVFATGRTWEVKDRAGREYAGAN